MIKNCPIAGLYRVSEHGAEVGGQCQHSQTVEDHPVEHSIPEAFGRQQHNKRDHEVSEENQTPGDEGTHHATAVLNEPEMSWFSIATVLLRPIQQGALLLHIPLTVA